MIASAAAPLFALLALVADAGGAADAGAAAGAIAAADAGASTVAPPALATTPSSSPAAPTGKLRGQVFEKGSRRPLAGAAITVDVTPAGDTGPDGAFELEVPCGRHVLLFQRPGFDSATVEARACEDAAPLTPRLAPRAGVLSYETVVRAPPPQHSVRLELAELTKTPGSLGDPFRALESLPGVASAAWPAAIYAVRGSNPGNTGFFLDSLRVPALFHFALGPSVIHPFFFQGMDFYPGGYPARYGRYVGGLVSAETRAPAEDAVHGAVDARLFDAGALVSAPLPGGRGAVMAAARYSYTGAVVSLLSDDIRLEYWDYQLRADRRVGPARLTLLAFGSSDVLVPSVVDSPNREIALRFHRVALRGQLPAAGGALLASVAVGFDRSKAPLADQFPITVDARSVSPRLAFRRPFGRADLEIGFDGELTRYTPMTEIMRPGALDLARPRDARLLAGYASSTVRAGPLALTPELRLDSYAIGAESRADLAPRLSARLEVAPGIWLNVVGGRFTQTPSMPLQVPGVESFGLGLYGLQRSWQGSLGVRTTRLRGLELDVLGFVQRYTLTDLRDPRLEEIDPLQDDLLVAREALSYGAEVMARRPQSERLHGWLSYTLSTSQRALGGGVIAPSDWDQRHIVNLVAGYSFGRTTVGGRAHYNTGRPVLVTDSVGAQLRRLPPFYQVDLRVERRMLFDRYVLDVYAELVNATLTRQVVGLTQDFQTQALHQQGFRVVIPSIGVHGEF